MSSTRLTPAPAAPPVGTRRVRHQARDAVTLMAFSLATASGLAATLLVLTHLSQGS